MQIKRIAMLSVLGLAAGIALAPRMAPPTMAQGEMPNPECKGCSATYVPVSELDAYTKVAIEHKLVDQQVRSVDLGKVQVGIGMVTRGKLELGKGGTDSVAEHDKVSEVYHIIDGSATLLTGPDLVGPKKRPDTMLTVREQNGPGFGAASIKNPLTSHLMPGDVIIIPAGTGHQFVEIKDHITYMMVRIDADKLLPLKSEEQSKAHLAHPYDPDKGNF